MRSADDCCQPDDCWWPDCARRNGGRRSPAPVAQLNATACPTAPNTNNGTE